MGRFVKGDIVVLSYPFSNFSGTKRRPALVIADLDSNDIVLCQITSQAKKDKYALTLEDNDFTDGKLNVKSFVRPNRIFTADSSIILYKACKISNKKIGDIINAVINIVNINTADKPKGKIIFLNGVSSAGKTTLAIALQDKLVEPYYIISIDTFFLGLMPQKKKPTTDEVGFNMFCKTFSGMHHVVRLYSDLGLNVIVDTLLLNNFFGRDPKVLEECVNLLREYPVMFVHVTCPLEELRRREKERDRSVEYLDRLLRDFVPKDTYDITVDTYNETKDACVDKIISFQEHSDKFTAFNILWSQRP
jgi:chloramphenicol 3-O-phosphotransferase